MPSKTVTFDSDRLGQVGGAATAFIVLTICLFGRELDAPTALIRAGWAFVCGYAVTFLLARTLLRLLLAQVVADRREKRERIRTRRRQTSETEEQAAPGPSVEGGAAPPAGGTTG